VNLRERAIHSVAAYCMGGKLRAWLALAVITLAVCGCLAVQPRAGGEWRYYGSHASGDRYSPLTQINRGNVATLREAWRFDMPEAGESQTNPLVIGRTIYAYTPGLKVIALDGATGRLLWTFDAGLKGMPMGDGRTFAGPSRGLAYWSDGHHSRLLVGVMNYLYALDPATGLPLADFGNQGAVDLRHELRGDFNEHYVSLTTPGIVYKNLIIVGFRTTESLAAPPGDIRAYDVLSGKLVWSFHTIPRPGEAGIETWPQDAWRFTGAANSWAGFALDEPRAIVYAPTGSAASDFYGADRLGDNLYANTLLALDAATGRRLWHFQTVHHDIWDRDLSSPPSLLTVRRNGRRIDAIAQPTKQGFLYVFDRVTGAPLFPIEEAPYPPSEVPGEKAAPSQPRPLAPAPFARQRLTEDLLTSRTPSANAWAVEQFRNMRSDGQFIPFTVGKQTIVFPGFDGGAEWGGSAVDVRTGVIYINSNDVAWSGALKASADKAGGASALYQSQCAACHGADRSGSPPAFPSLVNIGDRLSAKDIAAVINNGRGRMQPFRNIQSSALDNLVDFLRTGREPAPAQAPPVAPPQRADNSREMTASLLSDGLPAKYRFTGYRKFLDPDGYPAVAPPWGTLNAIDLNTGRYLWKLPLGQYPELASQGLADTGSENYGGPIVTAGGLLFIGATIFDHKLRAFDSASGALLWQVNLPFAGTATPATYMIDGKQYVVIATSNARNPKAPQGSAYVAFALP
jgi:quinoprotein glucose dehydrogenase